jgi:outer membrane lipoprotein-sorting protein
MKLKVLTKMLRHGLVLCCLLMLTGSSQAQNADSFIKELQNAFKSYETFQASFIQTGSALSGSAGTFFYKKQNKMRIEMPKLTLITDGTTVWNINKRENKAVISKYNEKDASLFSLPNLIEKYPGICRSKLEKTGNEYKLTLVPNDKKLNFKTADLICNSAKIITALHITDLSGNMLTIKLSQVKLNKAINDAQFNYSAKEGMKVIDLR